ncbi:alpha-amylase family glycosyl hydrolase [Dermabacter hominis]|uniref:alpha-amylase family glycosyl hydrolase n=1 Tax=Dermabacter hominis TaxID=36740 RepID=UPI0021A8ACCC|nr:alpha-amylase family glycosyl hydrolase [Dermabacter hominis]MCT2055677.1 alpha-amylase family glycosyl hydrolase [Dermabacter hominis]MCT2083344.1 alpha-amylase family glycosyl hydrolase [Dermabacter hominis]MCT2090596.1 alpha-amylase family glycosyl hydrolase [Dermabacter hominis]MCT2190683.1 alpha-amylase family glycosyl hydrolase [Dermabacter hominis]MCT2226811.1 alpha-amylase family glycosyl hydrolase [Dermabacter hominis]
MRSYDEDSGTLLAREPFHDNSRIGVPSRAAGLDASVPLRVWVPDSVQDPTVVLRQLMDGEPRFVTCTRGDADGAGHWFETELLARNPVTRYRFLVTGREDGHSVYEWLTAAGIADHDVSDAHDFTYLARGSKAPEWLEGAIVYQVFPDRFARSVSSGELPVHELPEWALPMKWDEPCEENGERNGRQIYGGDLKGLEERLGYLQDLGVSVVYMCPIFPAGSAHRYDASTFEFVDPLLGGNEALVSLTRAAHARGMKIVMDLTTNHTGNTHEWFARAQADATSEEAGFYFFTEHPDRYDGWLGIDSLPKLDYESASLRERMYASENSIVRRYLEPPFNVDGWRIDVANMTGRHGAQDLTHEVAREIREAMREDTWLVAEHFHDASADLAGDGWDGAMNYTGFTKPLWAWLSPEDSSINWLGLPIGVPKLPTRAVLATLREYNAQLPYEARLHSQNQLCSHDTARSRTVFADPDRHAAALGALVGLPGIPTLFAGDELALEGNNGEHSRTPMPWGAIDAGALPDKAQRWQELTKRVFAARHAFRALRSGGMRWLHAGCDSLTFIRTDEQEPVLVHLARAAHGEIALPESLVLASPSGHDRAAVCSPGLTLETAGSTRGEQPSEHTLTLHAERAGFALVPLRPLTAAPTRGH